MTPSPLEQRLAHLENLRAQGVLSGDEYQAARLAAISAESAGEALPKAPSGIQPKPGSVAAPAYEQHGTRSHRGAWLTGIAIVLVIGFVGLVAGVLLTRGGDSPAAAEAAPSPTPTPASPPPAASSPVLTFQQSCADDKVCPQIVGLRGEDMGGRIRVTLNYCDHTEGYLQAFVFDFRLADAQGVVQPWSVPRTLTTKYACNEVTADLRDNYPAGSYQVRATISNTDTQQQTTGRSAGFSIG